MSSAFRYIGPDDAFPVWGVTFQKGVAVQVDRADLARKLACLSSFERVADEAGEQPEPVKTKKPAGKKAKK